MSRFLTNLMSKPKAQEKLKTVEPEKPRLELVEDTQPIIPSQPNLPDSPKSVAPESDFTKVANSIARSAVPERLFKGMSKNTYDALYLKTRGAINPVRKIRATKSDLLRWCGVSDVTIDKHLNHLKSIGLVKVVFVIGSHEGNWYEVFIPEEVDLPNQPNQPNVPKKVGGLVPNLLGYVGGVQLLENKEVIATLKTSTKTRTKNDDDDARVREAFFAMAKRFDAATKKITGRGVSKTESEKWEMLADLLILELEAAASRAEAVSSIPSFLTEILRRQFFVSRQQQSSAKPGKTKIDTVGKSESESYEIKPLDEPGREAALAQLQEFADDEFLRDFKKWYTEEDWAWLNERLKRA